MSRNAKRLEKQRGRLRRLAWAAQKRHKKQVPQPEWRCERKRRFLCEETALSVACDYEREEPGDLIEAYLCELCGYWHIGHRRQMGTVEERR